MVGAKNDGLAFGPVMDADLCCACDTIPPIPLPSVFVPSLYHACRCRGYVCLAIAVWVIAGAVDLGEPPSLIEAGGQLAQLG